MYDSELDDEVMDEEVTFHEDMRESDEEFGDADAYYAAFSTVLREGVHDNHLALLRAHYAAQDHTTTWEALAKAVGYARGAAVNMQYGTFAKRVANAMGIQEAPRNFWLFVLVYWGPGLDPETGHTTFVLREPVIEALQRLAVLPTSSGTSLIDPEAVLHRLVPSEHRSDVLDAVATSIESVHWANPSGWACTLDGGHVVLTAGRYEVLRIGAGEPPFKLVVVSDAVPAAAEDLVDLTFSGEDAGYYASAPGSALCAMPFRRVGRAYALLAAAHTAFVAEFGRGALEEAIQDVHRPSLVDLVAQQVGRALPQPTYVER